MEFTVKRNDLLGELNLVQGVIEKRSTIPILANILLEAGEGRLDITATDLDVSIWCGCTAEVAASGASTVAARRFFDIIRLLPEDSDVRCKVLDNDWMLVTSGKSEYKVVGLPRENFPSVSECAGETTTIPGNLLRAMIQRVVFAITTEEESRYSLNGALLMLLPGEVRMVATDGHRLAVASGAVAGVTVDREVRALVPRKTVLELQRLLGDQELMVEYGRDENHLYFMVSGKRLVSRMLAGQFPNYEMVVPRENDKKVAIGTRMLSEAIRRAAVMADEKLKAVRMSIARGQAEITASSADAGEARETIDVEYDGADVDIGFNPQYLLEFLNVCGSESVWIELRDNETQGLLKPDVDTPVQYQYVVMPMKF
ncbi:MAG: DNA polymerase III subunit beta [Acidobacteria bacterium]|nr:DNA polymerase III subunit beta [Acidobacteriota bacterium]